MTGLWYLNADITLLCSVRSETENTSMCSGIYIISVVQTYSLLWRQSCYVVLLCTTILFCNTVWLYKLPRSWKIYRCPLVWGIEICISYFQSEHLNSQAGNYWCRFYLMRISTGTCSRFSISVQASCFKVLWWQSWCQYLFYLLLVVVQNKIYVWSSTGEGPCYSQIKSHHSQTPLFC